MADTAWVKARRSDEKIEGCVEQRRHARMIEVRDTKDAGAGPTLRFTHAEFAAWLDGAKRGEFDHLLDAS